MLLTLVLCVICPVVLSSDVQTVLPDNYDTKPIDGDEYGVRNYVSDHELPRDVPTRVKIVGDLGTPPPSVKLDFVPQQTYVQVRRYDAVKRLPQEAAMEEAATSEEVLNAPRLREVVTHKKTQEVILRAKTLIYFSLRLNYHSTVDVIKMSETLYAIIKLVCCILIILRLT